MSSNEKITHPRSPRPALSPLAPQPPLGHNDVRLTNLPTYRMSGVNEHGRPYPQTVLDSQGRPLRPGA